MADKTLDDVSCGTGAVVRKPWSTPHVILATDVKDTEKTFPSVQETHGTSPSTALTGS